MTPEEIEQLRKYGLLTPEELASAPPSQPPPSTQAAQLFPGKPEYEFKPREYQQPTPVSISKPYTPVSVYPSKTDYDTQGNLVSPQETRPLDVAIARSMDYHTEQYQNQQKKIGLAQQIINNKEDYSDDQIAEAHSIMQEPEVQPVPQKMPIDDLKKIFPDTPDVMLDSISSQDQKQRFVNMITPPKSQADVATNQYLNLQTGPSYRALQEAGLAFPGTGRSVPVFGKDTAPWAVQPIPGVQPAELVS